MQPLYEQQIWKVHNFPMIVIRSRELKITYYCDFCFIGYLIFSSSNRFMFLQKLWAPQQLLLQLAMGKGHCSLGIAQGMVTKGGRLCCDISRMQYIASFGNIVNRDSYCDYVITNILDYILENIVKILQYTQGCQWFWYIEFCIGNQFVFPKRGI